MTERKQPDREAPFRGPSELTELDSRGAPRATPMDLARLLDLDGEAHEPSRKNVTRRLDVEASADRGRSFSSEPEQRSGELLTFGGDEPTATPPPATATVRFAVPTERPSSPLATIRPPGAQSARSFGQLALALWLIAVAVSAAAVVLGRAVSGPPPPPREALDWPRVPSPAPLGSGASTEHSDGPIPRSSGLSDPSPSPPSASSPKTAAPGSRRARPPRRERIEPPPAQSAELRARWRRLGLLAADLALVDPSGAIDRWVGTEPVGDRRALESEVRAVLQRAELDPTLARRRVDRLLVQLKAHGRSAPIDQVKALEDDYFSLRATFDNFTAQPEVFWTAARDLELRLGGDNR